MFKVENLQVTYHTASGDIQACDDISFEIGNNETVGIVGESGCGKSTVGKALLRLLPGNAMVEADTLEFDGHDLLALSDEELRQIRWAELSMIPQSSMSAFDPVYTIKQQIIEAIQVHEDVSKKKAVEEVRRLFELVSLDPARMNDYPHQLSGGMKQRATIAMALALNPSFILADEITTALDVITQDALLGEIEAIKESHDMAMALISHDIGVIQETCDRMFVMYAGRIVEKIDPDDFDEPYHPYTVGLQNAFPDLDQQDDLISIPGTPPKLENPPTGCRFAPRCPFAVDECRSAEPPLEEKEERHASRCIRDDIVDTIRREGSEKSIWQGARSEDVVQ